MCEGNNNPGPIAYIFVMMLIAWLILNIFLQAKGYHGGEIPAPRR